MLDKGIIGHYPPAVVARPAYPHAVSRVDVQFRGTPPGTLNDWHVGPRRQFVITLSGRAEIEVASGKKIALEPGHIELIEDTTGKGHTTRVVGKEDRVSISIPLTDQTVATPTR